MASVDIKAYRATVLDDQGKVVGASDFVNGPTNGPDALVQCQYGAQASEAITIRLKTQDGKAMVRVRARNRTTAEGSAWPANDMHIAATATSTRRGYTVRIEELPKSQWKKGEAIDFMPPTVQIQATGTGWSITFLPSQMDAIFTVVLGEGVKPETLPSVPFPSGMGFTRAVLQLSAGEYGAKAGMIVRLGVRGAGRSVSVALPAPGQTQTVEPEHFKVSGAADAQHLGRQVALQKFQEKQNEGTTVGYS